MKKYIDFGSVIVMIITFILFFIALFIKGFTHDLLLEAGIFLVSLKLIMMSYKIGTYVKVIDNDLQKIKKLIKQ